RGAGDGGGDPHPVQQAGDDALRVLEEDVQEVLQLHPWISPVPGRVLRALDRLPRLVRESVQVHMVRPPGASGAGPLAWIGRNAKDGGATPVPALIINLK